MYRVKNIEATCDNISNCRLYEKWAPYLSTKQLWLKGSQPLTLQGCLLIFTPSATDACVLSQVYVDHACGFFCQASLECKFCKQNTLALLIFAYTIFFSPKFRNISHWCLWRATTWALIEIFIKFTICLNLNFKIKEPGGLFMRSPRHFRGVFRLLDSSV